MCLCSFLFPEKATIRLTSEEYIAYAGASLNLSAVVTGKPLPSTIRLEKLNQNFMTYPNGKYSVIDLSTILIHRLSLEDSGKYRACVENSDDLIDCYTFNIAVQGNLTCMFDLKGISKPNVYIMGDLCISTS